MQATQELTSVYKGGETYKTVLAQIIERYGEQEVEVYNPSTNCFTYQGWQQRGFQVKKGEKAFKSYTFISGVERDKENPRGKIRKYFKSVSLFYHLQVSKK